MDFVKLGWMGCSNFCVRVRQPINDYIEQWLINNIITSITGPRMIVTRLTPMFNIEQRVGRCLFWERRGLVLWISLNPTNSLWIYLADMIGHYLHSVNSHVWKWVETFYLALIRFEQRGHAVSIPMAKAYFHYLIFKSKYCWSSVDFNFHNPTGSMLQLDLPTTAAYTSVLKTCHQSHSGLTRIQQQELMTIHWRELSASGRHKIIIFCARQWGIYSIYECLLPISSQITKDAKTITFGFWCTRIFRLVVGTCHSCDGL